LDLLDADKITAALTPAAQAVLAQLQVLNTVDSTNTALAKGNYGSGTAMLAEQQTAGRGRRGRVWVSPLAANVYLSVRWHFSAGIASLEGLSLAVGVVIADALAELGIADIQLKWPNDVWWQGQKLGGVLVEVGGDVQGDCYAVVGVGLNVAMPAHGGQDIDQAWVDLAAAGYRSGRNLLASRLLSHLLLLLSRYQAQTFGAYRQHWLARNALAGLPVVVSGEQALVGTVVGLSENGGLQVQTAQGLHLVAGGEITVRRHDS
jgi:BirA family biotin operon repressor/biotin-[acetyl-CoA-carboxylase] ligase